MNDWRPVIRRVFGGIWLYVWFLTVWAVASRVDPRIPEFDGMWVWVPFQIVGWVCGAWFLCVAAAWGIQEATTAAHEAARAARAGWARVSGRVRLPAPQTAPAGAAVVPSTVIPAADAHPRSLAQLVYDHMQTRPNHGGRAQEMLDEMREAGLFVLAGVPEPVDAVDFSNRLTKEGWPKLADKRRPGYPGMATGFRHVDQIDFDAQVTFRPDPNRAPCQAPYQDPTVDRAS